MEHNRRYKFEESAGIWVPSTGTRDFAYSDGEESEGMILEAVSNAQDRSAGSDELASRITSWPTEYHLSPTRLNLLAPFQFQDRDVMEIGAGCGALTRFLADSGARVTALEGSPRRARITAARCQGLKNVTVVCDNFSDFETDRKFDAMIAVGVLEYAPSFFRGPDPVDSFLTKARGFLKTDGTLFVAIENQLGLKYFAGCSEDHTGMFFYGIEDRYKQERSTVTFGRAKFLSKLNHAGFRQVDFFYPFPDYKLPRIIFSEAGMTTGNWDVGQIIGEFPARDYHQPRFSLFSEQAAWPVIARNLLAQEFSNSFLALASAKERAPVPASADWLAQAFSSYRKKTYRTVTTFRKTGETIKVAKKRMYPDLPDGPSAVAKLKILPETDFLRGETLQHMLVKRLINPKTDFGDLVAVLAPWGNLLKNSVLAPGDYHSKGFLPGDFIDCVPWNLICGEFVSSDLIYFDAEWEYLPPLPLHMPFVRGLLHLDIWANASEFLPKMPIKDLIIMIGEKLGFSLSEPNLNSMIELNAEFASSVTYCNQEHFLDRFKDRLAHPYTVPQNFDELVRERNRLRSRLAETQEQLRSMLNSHSWKITSPLRRGYDLVERLWNH